MFSHVGDIGIERMIKKDLIVRGCTRPRRAKRAKVPKHVSS